MKTPTSTWRIWNRWRKKCLTWSGLAICVVAAFILFAHQQGGGQQKFWRWKEAFLSVEGNVIASALVGIALLLFWEKWLRRNAFFPADEVSFLRRKKLSRKELEAYEAERYMDILGKIDKHARENPRKNLFSFLLTGPEQSGKTSFAHYVNGKPGLRRKCLALEVPYAAIAGNPAALDEVFHWLCEGDESERIRYRIIVFHAGNSVRQVNELVEKLRIIQERFRKTGNGAKDSGSHKILLMVQFTGRRPLEAISADFKWAEILDGVFMLKYVSPDWIRKKLGKSGKPEADLVRLTRQLYLHSLGVPEWFNVLSGAASEEELFNIRHVYLEHLFPKKDNKGNDLDFWKSVFRARCADTLPFRFLANTFLLEKIHARDSALTCEWDRFLNDDIPSMDLVNGRAALKACGERFFGPLSEAFLLYHGFLPTVFRRGDDAEKRTVREVLEEMLKTMSSWREEAGSNAEHLRRRLLLEFGLPFFPYLSMCGVRLDDESMKTLRTRLLECVHSVVEENDVDYAGPALALLLGMECIGPDAAELERLAEPDVVKLAKVLWTDKGKETDPALEWAPRFLAFAALCENLYPDHLSRMAELFFSYAGHKLYQAFLRSKLGPLQSFHRLGECIQAFRRLACRSRDVFLINKLVELETLRLSFSRPTRYGDIAAIVDDYLTDKYGFLNDSKDFLQCRSWLRKTLCSEQLAKGNTSEAFSLPEYDDGWQTILHPSELWMANHAVQQVFLLAGEHHDIPVEKVRTILDDLMHRLHWYRGYVESAGESLPIVFANELLFAQINFLTYRKLVRSEPPDSGWRGLGLSPETEREVADFCEQGLVEAQCKAWRPMPDDPREKRRASASCGCRLACYLLVAFRRGLLDDGQWFVRPPWKEADSLPGTVLFRGRFPERDALIGEVIRVARLLGDGALEILAFLEKTMHPDAERGS